LTLMELGNQEELTARLGQEKTSALMSDIGNFLRQSAADAHTAGRLGQDKFGVMHDEKISGDHLRNSVAEMSRKADPEGRGFNVAANNVAIAGDGLSEKERARALVYTINKYVATKSGEFSIDNLDTGF